MRIGIMWRHVFERGGIALYSRRIVEHLISLDPENEYALFVPPGVTLDRASPNVRLIEVAARSRWTWDQRGVPLAAERERLDLVFNPKLSVPLSGRFRTVFTLHGMEQFVEADAFPMLDRMYVHTVMPRYCRRADAVLCPTHAVKATAVERLHLAPEKVHVTPYGLDNRFARPVAEEDRQRVTERYALPEHYLLFVGGLTPLKNLRGILRALSLLKDHLPHKLVVSGFDRWGAGADTDLVESLGLTERVVRAGWVEPEDQPALYSMATALLVPSLYEGFGFPVIEAMASGCPVVTSVRGSLPEVSGGAALLVDPLSPSDIADAVWRIVHEPRLRPTLIQKGRQRAGEFDWNRTARQVLSVFRSLVADGGTSYGLVPPKSNTG